MNFSQSSINELTTHFSNMDSSVMGQSDVNSLGIVLSSRPVTASSKKAGAVVGSRDAEQTISESPWTLNNMLERFSFKGTYDWPSSATSHTVLQKFRIPQDLLVNNLTLAPFQNFNFWRGDVELRIQVTATPFHQGCLMGVFVPLVSDSVYTSTNILSNFSAASVNQCVYLFPNTNTSSVLHISYNSPKHYIDITQSDPAADDILGYFYLVVFNPIQLSASASDTATVSVFSRFLHNEFKVPRRNITTLSARPQSIQREDVTGFVKNVTSGAIDALAASILPETISAGQIINTLGMAMLDEPTDPRLVPNVVSATERMNFSHGVQHLDKLTMDPSQVYTSKPSTFGTNVDEMEFSYLSSKYSYLGSFKVLEADTVGKVVARFPMNPTPNNIILDNNKVPLLSYITFPFNFWRGGLNYKFQVVSTSLQTSKLFVALSYNDFEPQVTADLSQITSQYGMAFEINQGSNEFEITAPFASTTPYKYVPVSNVPTSADSLGMVNIIVLNRLVCPNNTPLEITINVFISGAHDYEVSTLTSSNTFSNSYIARPTMGRPIQAKPQSSVAPLVIDSNDVTVAATNIVAPETSQVDRKPAVTQVSPFSVQHILKKYQAVPNIAPIENSNFNYTLYQVPISELFRASFAYTSSSAVNTQTQNGLLTWFSSLYRQFRGPLRFKIYAPQGSMLYDEGAYDMQNNILHVLYEPPLLGTFTAGASAQAQDFINFLPVPGNAPLNPFGTTVFPQNFQPFRLPVSVSGTATSRFLEFEIPFSSIYESLLVRHGGIGYTTDSTASDLGRLFIYMFARTQYTEETDLFSDLSMFVSFGDETRFATLYDVPRIVPSFYLVDTAKFNYYGTNYSTPSVLYNSLTIL